MKHVFLFLAIVLSLMTFANDGENSANYSTKRFASYTEIGTAHYLGHNFFTASETWGIKINPYVFVGQGMHLNISSNRWMDISATADVKVTVLDKKISPIFSVGFGLNKSNQTKYYDEGYNLNSTQFICNVATGIKVAVKENKAVLLNGGYRLLADSENQIHGGFVKVGFTF